MKQRRPLPHQQQSGYTLLELLLYIAMLGILLIPLSFFFIANVTARVKNQSIIEVNEQGQAVMDYMTQTIRNATSITTPTAASNSPSLTLVVPTGSLSPTVFDISGSIIGYNGAGTNTDGSDSNAMQATKFTASATGTIKTLYALVGAVVAASPNNLGQMAIYNGTSSAPTSLIASSPSSTLLPNSWIAFNLSSPVSVTSGQIYWLVYNTNGIASTDNNIQYHAGTTGQSNDTPSVTFGNWPAWTVNNGSPDEFCMYAPIMVSGTPSNARVKEGAGSAVALSNNNVDVNGINFKNLTRAGTNGLVQITFTVSRINPNNRNEYDYSKTFTTTAEIGW